jgi:hypothetical protein
LDIRTRKLEEEALTKTRENPSQPVDSVLLPLPEVLPVVPAGFGDTNPDMFGRFRRFGLTYLDENGEQLEFSAGIDRDDDEGRLNQREETGAAPVLVSEYSDSESDAVDPQPEWPMQDTEQEDYWPYPSKTVSGILEQWQEF